MGIKFDCILDLKIALAELRRTFKDAEVQEVDMKKTICDICYGSVTPSDGKYLCLSGCGHVEGKIK